MRYRRTPERSPYARTPDRDALRSMEQARTQQAMMEAEAAAAAAASANHVNGTQRSPGFNRDSMYMDMYGRMKPRPLHYEKDTQSHFGPGMLPHQKGAQSESTYLGVDGSYKKKPLHYEKDTESHIGSGMSVQKTTHHDHRSPRMEPGENMYLDFDGTYRQKPRHYEKDTESHIGSGMSIIHSTHHDFRSPRGGSSQEPLTSPGANALPPSASRRPREGASPLPPSPHMPSHAKQVDSPGQATGRRFGRRGHSSQYGHDQRTSPIVG